MPVKKYSVVSREDQYDIVSVFSFENENMSGVFHNNAYGEDRGFGNLVSLILMLEDCMNQISFPQPMSKFRKMDKVSELDTHKKSFRENAEIVIPDYEIPAEWKNSAPIAVFKIRIIFRTISGWQGEAVCLENENQIKFKSDLELIRFMVTQLRSAAEQKEMAN